MARVLTDSADDAWDLTQDCLIQVGLRWHRLDAARNRGAYARATLVNLNKNVRRARARERARTGRAAYTSESVSPTVPDWLIEALGSLPRQQRAVIALHVLEDLDTAEVAAILGCSVSTVRSTLSRGLARLRASMPTSDA